MKNKSFGPLSSFAFPTYASRSLFFTTWNLYKDESLRLLFSEIKDILWCDAGRNCFLFVSTRRHQMALTQNHFRGRMMMILGDGIRLLTRNLNFSFEEKVSDFVKLHAVIREKSSRNDSIETESFWSLFKPFLRMSFAKKTNSVFIIWSGKLFETCLAFPPSVLVTN